MKDMLMRKAGLCTCLSQERECKGQHCAVAGRSIFSLARKERTSQAGLDWAGQGRACLAQTNFGTGRNEVAGLTVDRFPLRTLSDPSSFSLHPVGDYS